MFLCSKSSYRYVSCSFYFTQRVDYYALTYLKIGLNCQILSDNNITNHGEGSSHHTPSEELKNDPPWNPDENSLADSSSDERSSNDESSPDDVDTQHLPESGPQENENNGDPNIVS